MIKKWLFYLWNLYPPFVGAGIWIEDISKDFLSVRVRLKKRPWTLNIVGTQFGGSICSMTDPFYMALLMTHLGKEYIVWDKSSSVRFRKPGRKALIANFQLTKSEIEDIKNKIALDSKMDWEREVLVKDVDGVVVAEVKKVIYIARKKSMSEV